MSPSSVLIISADRKLVRSLSEAFQDLGLRVETAYDYPAAMTCLDEDLPSLICLDFTLPHSCEMSLCQMLETDAAGRDVPIIGLAETWDEATIAQGGTMCLYRLRRTPEVAGKLRPFVEELVGVPASIRQPDYTSDI